MQPHASHEPLEEAGALIACSWLSNCGCVAYTFLAIASVLQTTTTHGAGVAGTPTGRRPHACAVAMPQCLSCVTLHRSTNPISCFTKDPSRWAPTGRRSRA